MSIAQTETLTRPVPPVAVRGPGGVRRHVLSVPDPSADEVAHPCRRAPALKHAASHPQALRGRTVGVYFRETSTRTRTGFDVVCTRRWQEMGVVRADAEWKTRFHPFRVTRAPMDRARSEGAVFMRDLPAVRGEEVDDEVLDGPRSLARVRAQHERWSAMAVMGGCGAGVQDQD